MAEAARRGPGMPRRRRYRFKEAANGSLPIASCGRPPQTAPSAVPAASVTQQQSRIWPPWPHTRSGCRRLVGELGGRGGRGREREEREEEGKQQQAHRARLASSAPPRSSPRLTRRLLDARDLGRLLARLGLLHAGGFGGHGCDVGGWGEEVEVEGTGVCEGGDSGEKTATAWPLSRAWPATASAPSPAGLLTARGHSQGAGPVPGGVGTSSEVDLGGVGAVCSGKKLANPDARDTPTAPHRLNPTTWPRTGPFQWPDTQGTGSL